MGGWQIFWVVLMYLLAVILWFILIWLLQIPLIDVFDFLILLIPLIVFGVAIGSANQTMSKENEFWVFKNNYSNSISIVVFPILLWAASKIDLHQEFLLIVIAATCFAMLTFYDWWVSDEQFFFVKHFRTIFQTISITLVLVALKLFYCDQMKSRGRRRAKKSSDEGFEAIIATTL